MLNVYPFASGSVYTASFAISASTAQHAKYVYSVPTAIVAESVAVLVEGDIGKSVCLLTYEQYLLMINNGYSEFCDFSDD